MAGSAWSGADWPEAKVRLYVQANPGIVSRHELDYRDP